MLYANPAMFAATFFVVWAIATSYSLRTMYDDSNCFDGGLAKALMFAFAAVAWSALCGILAALLVEMAAGLGHVLFN